VGGRILEVLDRWSASAGPVAYVVLGLSALIEYVFPPFPGDTVVLLGGVYAVRGQKPWTWVFAVITLGSLLGAAIDYWIGTRIGDRVPWVTPEQFQRAQLQMRRRGHALIVLNRFIPALRGVLFLAAGAARMPFRTVIALGAISAIAWNALLLGAGLAVGGNAERLEELFRRYQVFAWTVLSAAVLAWLLLAWFRRRSKSA